MIDLARLLCGFCTDLIDNNTFFDALLRAADLSIDHNVPSSPKVKETNVLLVLRSVANVLQEGTKIGDGSWIKKVGFRGAQSHYSLAYAVWHCLV